MRITLELAIAQNLALHEKARLLALSGIGLADAAITFHDPINAAVLLRFYRSIAQ